MYADKPKEQKALTFHRCQTVTFKGRPFEVYEMFYRYLAYFAEQYQAISEHCGFPANPSGKDCVNAIFKVADVNGDGKIAPAEIAKLVRDLSKRTVFFNGSPGDPKSYAIYFTRDAIRASQAASILLGPWVSGLIMANLDYDGNGVITPDELALTLGSGSSASSADWIRLFEQSKEQLSSLMPVLTGLSQFLGLGAAARR